MPKCVFDKLSNGDASKSTALLSKAQTTEIMGYGQNPINYVGTCVFCVKHNNIEHDVLFFITNVDDTKGHFGLKSLSGIQIDKECCVITSVTVKQ